MKKVLVFKTSVQKKKQVRYLKPALNQLMSLGEQWNFDLEDCDNILRIETHGIQAQEVSSVLIKKGFYCRELPY